MLLALITLMAAPVMAIPSVSLAQDLSDNPKYSAIVVDAQSGEVFYARRADSARYPASLTKIMTLYMAFDALARGQLKPTDQIVMSQHAVSQAPVKVYLQAGDTIDVDTAMRLIALYSANDLAVALAEKIGGTEERFAALMTIRAQELGMTQTRFVNANGLPDPRQLSSARDLAILARAVMRDYPQYYGYFNQESMAYRGRTYVNHNPLHGLPGVDGMKTGYTNAAGYNLVALAGQGRPPPDRGHAGRFDQKPAPRARHRTDEHGLRRHRSPGARRTDRGGAEPVRPRRYGYAGFALHHLANADSSDDDDVGSDAAAAPADTARSYASLSDDQLRDTLASSEQANASDEDVQRLSAKVSAPAVVATLTKKAVPAPAATPLRTTRLLASATPPKGKKKNPDAVWSVQVGAFKDKSLANNWIKNIQQRFDDALADATSQVTPNGNGWYRTRFASLTKEQAQQACKSMSAKRLDCMVIKPDA
ncbi:MAG: D-alanyl-D-alanine carboxypeptidase [Asticcacaulis sp.]